MVAATALYGALLVPLYIFMSARIIVFRRGNRVAFGDKGHAALEVMIRAHGNFAEYVPFTLVLMALAEINGVAAALLHGVGLALLIGRYTHGLGLCFAANPLRWRTLGMVLTFTALASAALLCLFSVL